MANTAGMCGVSGRLRKIQCILLLCGMALAPAMNAALGQAKQLPKAPPPHLPPHHVNPPPPPPPPPRITPPANNRINPPANTRVYPPAGGGADRGGSLDRRQVRNVGPGPTYRQPANTYRSQDGRMQAQYGRNGRPEFTRVDHGGGMVQTTRRLPGGGRMVDTVRPAPGGGVVRTVSYGPGRGFVERPIYGHPGFVRRSYFEDGRSRAVVYRNYSYRGVPYYRPVPAYIYSPGFYAWGNQPWGVTVNYGWGWGAQPWYGVYGGYFTPYGGYTSLDYWMTDYVIAASLQQAYAAGQADAMNPGPAGNPNGPDPNGPAPDPNAYQPNGGGQGGNAPYGNAPNGGGGDLQQPMSDGSAPPAITPEMKAEIAAQVRLEMQEQQQEAAAGAAGVAGPPPDPSGTPPEEVPDALKPGHILFRVVTPLSVQANGQACNLNPDDYITRTGSLNADGTVTVQVKASRPVDCLRGATTTVALNDLMSMESDQQERITEGFQVASQNMGRNGLPAGPPAGAVAVPAGQTVADQNLGDTFRQQQSTADSDERAAAAVQVGSGF